MKKRIVIKIGTNVMTDEKGRVTEETLSALVNDIAFLMHEGHKVVLVTSGAVASGKARVAVAEKDLIIKKQILAAIGQPYLMSTYCSFFEKKNISVAQALLTRDDFLDRRRYTFVRRTLEGLLSEGVLPIVNENDVVAVEELSFSDNDGLATMLAVAMNADILVLLTNTDGLYTADPTTHANAKRLLKVERADRTLADLCSRKTSTLGSGGMLSKVHAAILATHAGVTTIVANGKKSGVLLTIMHEQPEGTLFLPKNKRLGEKERWLLIGASSAAKLVVDDGAAKAVQKGKSLLAVGVCAVQGAFQANDVVEIVNMAGLPLGYGKVYYGSDELNQRLLSKKPFRHEVVHRDHFVSL